MDLSCKKIEKLILRYVNASRKKRGISSLGSNYGLKKLARNHSKRMARQKRIWHGDGVHLALEKVTHKGFWGFIESLFSSYRRSGENVATMPIGRVRGFRHSIQTNKDVAKAFHKSWMNSAGHKKNILDSHFSLVGIGVKRRGKIFYATQVFVG